VRTWLHLEQTVTCARPSGTWLMPKSGSVFLPTRRVFDLIITRINLDKTFFWPLWLRCRMFSEKWALSLSGLFRKPCASVDTRQCCAAHYRFVAWWLRQRNCTCWPCDKASSIMNKPVTFLFWEAAPKTGRHLGPNLIDIPLPFAWTWDPGCKFIYQHIKGGSNYDLW
jgi:hypothetical protein